MGLEPTRDPPTPVFRGIQRLYQLSYDSDTTFFQQILFNHSFDDTDDNRVDTIWLLGLQLLKALTGLMVIAYIIMIGKLI